MKHESYAIEDLFTDVNRAVSAASLKMDYEILQIIIGLSKESKKAYARGDYMAVQYLSNKHFWDIGSYIKNKLNLYKQSTSDFFQRISSNIENYFDDRGVAYTKENLMRCFKLVELANPEWFEQNAGQFTWDQLAKAIDLCGSFDELKNYFSIHA